MHLQPACKLPSCKQHPTCMQIKSNRQRLSCPVGGRERNGVETYWQITARVKDASSSIHATHQVSIARAGAALRLERAGIAARGCLRTLLSVEWCGRLVRCRGLRGWAVLQVWVCTLGAAAPGSTSACTGMSHDVDIARMSCCAASAQILQIPHRQLRPNR